MLWRNWPLTFPWCQKVGGHFRASGTEGREMAVMEKRQSKANCSGFCPCQIRTYDERVPNPARASIAAGTPVFSTFLYQSRPKLFRPSIPSSAHGIHGGP